MRWLTLRPRGASPVGRSPRQPGQAAVEFALVLPLFLLITAGTIEFGRGFLACAQLMQAAQSGTRYAAVLGHARDRSDIVQHVQLTAPGGMSDDVTVICSLPTTPGVAGADCVRGNLLTVMGLHRQVAIIPFFPMPALVQQASATLVVE